MDDAELVRPMKAYWYDFEPTGVDCIDKVLSAVACAGKAYHHTEYWYEPARPYGGHSGGTPVEWIQNAAKEPSDRIEALIAERDAARDAALEEAAKAAESPDLLVFKRGWSPSQDAAAISTMMAVAAAIRAMKGKSHE